MLHILLRLILVYCVYINKSIVNKGNQWKVISSGMWRRIVRYKLTDLSEERPTSVFYLDDGGDMFLRNVGWLSSI
jgi:hypothetical protein